MHTALTKCPIITIVYIIVVAIKVWDCRTRLIDNMRNQRKWRLGEKGESWDDKNRILILQLWHHEVNCSMPWLRQQEMRGHPRLQTLGWIYPGVERPTNEAAADNNSVKLTGEIARSSAMQATVRQKTEFECDSLWSLAAIQWRPASNELLFAKRSWSATVLAAVFITEWNRRMRSSTFLSHQQKDDCYT
jgi:hypothetical protein